MSVRARLAIGDFDGGITDGTIPFSHISVASTNSMLVKRGQGCLSSFVAMNVSGSVRYLKLYDMNRPPDAGLGTPLRRYAIPASTTGKGIVFAPKIPIQFNRGLGFTITGGAADNDTTQINAREVILTFECAPGAPDAAVTTAYTTSFTTTENPLAEFGIWLNGRTDGLVWQDFKALSSVACAGAASSTVNPPYDDAIAQIKTSAIALSANQYIEGTVFRAGGYSPGNTHELGLFVRMAISANSARGYEAYLNHTGNHSVVRWNGPLNDFTVLGGENISSVTTPANGDLVRLEVTGQSPNITINFWQNNNLRTQITGETVWGSGQSGLQSYMITGGTPESYGYDTITTGNL